MTNPDIRLCTTFELECIINEFTWFDNRLLTKVKRELDRRHRNQLIKKQFNQIIENYEKSTKTA